MNNKSLSQKMRSTISPIADTLHLGSLLRQMFVETRLLGEYSKFALHGYPAPSTSIILAGSGRSGTTWLTEVLCALPGVQQIFEPLFPPWNPQVRALTGWDKRDPYIRAIYLRPEEENEDWQTEWQRILTGRVRNYWTDYNRSSYFPDRFLIKEVRANMMLGYLHRQFQPRIIYIMRHPCAVVYSRLAAPQPWHADVQDILQQEDLLNDHLQPWVEAIAAETDVFGAHAVWWAVENHVALQQLRGIPHFLVYYEDLVMQPETVLDNLMPWLGYEQMPPGVEKLLSRPSRMSHANLAYQDKQMRLSNWQKQVSSADQERILSWAHRLNLAMYNETALPVP
jgi:hypothetical protein